MDPMPLLAASTQNTTMEPANKLLRFFYLGNFEPVHSKKKVAISVELENLITQSTGEVIYNVLKKCIVDNRDNPPRMDAVCYFVTQYFASTQTEENKTFLGRNYIGCIRTTDDLFRFAKYSADIRKCLNKKGFSKITRKIITKWYQQQKPNDLAEMLCTGFGMYGWTHADLFKLCHINFNAYESKKICEIALRRKDVNEGTNSTTAFASAPVAPAPASLPAPVPAPPPLQSVPAPALAPEPYMNKLLNVLKLRRCENFQEAAKVIKENKLSIEHVPPYLLHSINIAENLLPRMSLKQLLTYVFTFHDMKLLRQKKFSYSLARRLSCNEILKDGKIHPIVILLALRKYQKQMRYPQPIKKEFYMKKMKKFQLEPKKHIATALYSAFEKSFKYWPQIGLRIFVTINLQENYKTKSVFGFKQLSCMEASIVLAYSIFRREKNSQFYTFSAGEGLKQIEWKEECTYEEANEVCEKLVQKHNIQRITAPIYHALEKPEIFDLFVVIVSTSTLGVKNFMPPTKVLEMYRQKKNPNARVLVISLKRHKPGLKHEESIDTGFMEICGMDERAPAVMNAYAKKLFS